MADPLSELLDPENAPARHGEWHSHRKSMGEESVVLTDDDGCDLFVDPWEVAVLVNRAVDRLVLMPGGDATWTCSCGLTRPMTGSYGCADCNDPRPEVIA